MLRVLKKAGWVSGAALLIVVVVAIAVYVNVRYPVIKLEESGSNIIVHAETLSEYPTSIDRIVIAKIDPADDVAFEADGEGSAQIRRFVIHAGSNDVDLVHAAHGTYRTLIPQGRSFVLARNEPYQVTLCEAGRCRSSQFSFGDQ
jgi:hypothetical protein